MVRGDGYHPYEKKCPCTDANTLFVSVSMHHINHAITSLLEVCCEVLSFQSLLPFNLLPQQLTLFQEYKT